VRLLPTTMMPRPVPAWGAILLDESPVNRWPDHLAGGDRHSVELTEACNQSWKPMTLLDFFESTGCLAGAIPTNNR